ncbi:MAG: DNA adenine methylase [Candidatus Omnitrophica bacterium]|nr:DNA adenine methylase [Candidatus Omnitrophota bacterium]
MLANVLAEKKRTLHEGVARPFLKWAGGKTQLLSQFGPLFPPKGYFKKYLEPFVGSGAVFFQLQPHGAHLADNNEELMNCYKQIQRHVEAVVELLRTHKRLHSTAHYYRVRSFQPRELSPVGRAARFIYLNKTCFNGLHRVNSKGKFNVPMGRYTDPPILDERGLWSAHRALKGVGLHCMLFDRFCSEFADRGDFVYFDPPYFPISATANFTSYTKDNFGYEDQVKLKETFERLENRGCFVMLSNSATGVIRNLYKRYQKTTYEVQARRVINSNAKHRQAITELVILNYNPANMRPLQNGR